jgi:hypothetical protein
MMISGKVDPLDAVNIKPICDALNQFAKSTRVYSKSSMQEALYKKLYTRSSKHIGLAAKLAPIPYT